jgi:integrase
MPDLSRKRARDRLSARREPYWQRLAEGAYLGFRAGPSTWIARFRARDGRHTYRALSGIQPNDYDGAKREAEEWLERMGAVGVRTARRATVRTALAAYLEDLLRHGRGEASEAAQALFKLTVYSDPLADLALERVSREDFLNWRDRLREGREPRSVNRYVSQVTAALNVATEMGYVGNSQAWKLRRLADDTEDEGTAVFLNPVQRRGLIGAASQQACDFFRALDLTGARPGEMAATTVEDFNGKTLKLSHKKGRPPKLQVRHVVLTEEGIAHFTRTAADQPADALLFTADDGRAWNHNSWAYAMRCAIAKHNENVKEVEKLPAGTSAYSFRHARISELLQVHGVDPLTVAQQTGTSLKMIEKAYLRFIPSAMLEKLAAVREA